jgi:ubiquinone/menaquinone biosynthesis C-methylase UbiE
MIGIDISPEMLNASQVHAVMHGLPIELLHGTGSRLPIPDESVDLLFCHQTFHHLVDQEGAISDFHRVLKPGGLLLFAESTRAYIHSWMIRLLFRHPMEVQKSAPEYLSLVRAAGFEVHSDSVSYPYLWWSRGDLGLAERLIGLSPPVAREETLINLVAVRR